MHWKNRNVLMKIKKTIYTFVDILTKQSLYNKILKMFTSIKKTLMTVCH